MLKFILRRLAEAIPVIFTVITITFFLVRFAPGGPFDSEKNVSAEVMENLNARYHLNDPLHTQYLNYLGNLANFDLGPSFKYPNRTVDEMIANGFPITFELGVYSLLIALLVGVTAGTIASSKPNTLRDYFPMSIAMIGICFPTFLLGPILALIFGIWLEWLPVSGWAGPEYKVLPALTLGFAYAPYIARLSRGGMLEIMSQDFIRTARAKGLSEKLVVIRHALRGGLSPVIAFLGPALAGLLAGSFVIETIFQIPGLGRYYVQAAFNRDYTMILGTTIFLATLIVLFNMIADIVQVWLNPKLNFDSAGGGSK